MFFGNPILRVVMIFDKQNKLIITRAAKQGGEGRKNKLLTGNQDIV